MIKKKIKNVEIYYNISIEETYSDSCTISIIFYHPSYETSSLKEILDHTSGALDSSILNQEKISEEKESTEHKIGISSNSNIIESTELKSEHKMTNTQLEISNKEQITNDISKEETSTVTTKSITSKEKSSSYDIEISTSDIKIPSLNTKLSLDDEENFSAKMETSDSENEGFEVMEFIADNPDILSSNKEHPLFNEEFSSTKKENYIDDMKLSTLDSDNSTLDIEITEPNTLNRKFSTVNSLTNIESNESEITLSNSEIPSEKDFSSFSNIESTSNNENSKIEKSTLEVESTSQKIESLLSELDTNNEKVSSSIDNISTILESDFTYIKTNIICYNTCLSCNEDSIFDDNGKIMKQNCKKCKEGYYFEFGTNDCYSNETIGKNYFLDTSEEQYKWIKCFENCETCNKFGNITNMNCLSCKANQLKLNLYGDCVSICPNGTYELSLNNTCLAFCPNDYEINEEGNQCVKKMEYMTSSEFKTQIMKDISNFISTENSSKIINGSDFIALILPSDDMDPKEQIEKGISAIDLGNCTNVIKEYYNMSQNESFYVLNIESKKNESEKAEDKTDNSFNLGKQVQIDVYDKSGNKLDLSICKQDIKIMSYIGDAEELDIESAKSLSEQGIDVFNANDDFFNDICHDYSNTDGKDIIINDRRNDIYQNATFCQKGCSYSGINYELMAANCICNSSTLQSNSNKNNTNNENNNDEETVTFKALTKSIIENLFDFNIDVVKCYNLVFNKKIFYNNVGFYCMIFLFILQIIFLIVYLIKRLKPLKLFMLKFNRYNIKTTNSFPPPKNTRKINNSKYNYESNKENAFKAIVRKNKVEPRNDRKILNVNPLLLILQGPVHLNMDM